MNGRESRRFTFGYRRTEGPGIVWEPGGFWGVTNKNNHVKLLQRANTSGASNRIEVKWLFALRINHEERNYVS